MVYGLPRTPHGARSTGCSHLWADGDATALVELQIASAGARRAHRRTARSPGPAPQRLASAP